MQKVQKIDGNPVLLTVADGISVTVIEHGSADYLMPTSDVAKGYGVAENTIRSHKTNGEFQEGVHYIPAVEIFDGSQNRRTTMWTKAGVIRLGFFIKSERAKMFRDWAEQVVLAVTAPKVELPRATRRNHNRLSKDRLVELLSLVALVDDKTVRTALVQKLMPDLSIPAVQLQLPFIGGKGGEQK
ncbi:MAG: hypothetical protein JNM22_01940 [Saprospiraceae bacterium]|nr:hypothetical protein [Saprospiraceae bacterium]